MVVVLPEPVGPVTRMSPRLWQARSFITGGRPSFSKLGISVGMRRSTMARPLTVSSRLMRTRANENVWEVSYSLSLKNISSSPGSSSSRSHWRKQAGSVTGQLVRKMSPRLR